MSALPIASRRQKWASAFGDSDGSSSPSACGDAHEFGEPVTAFADVVAHRPGDVLVAPGGDQRLDDEVAAGIATAAELPAGEQQQLRDRPAGIGGEHLGEQSRPVRT